MPDLALQVLLLLFLAAMLAFETAIQPPPEVRYSMPLKKQRQKELEAA